MKNRLRQSEAQLLWEVVSKHQPRLLSLLQVLGTRPLTIEEREALREAVADEFSAVGLDENDEPNARGIALEDLIDRLGHL